MANQLLLIELKGNHYLYDMEGNAFLEWDNPDKKVLFSEIQNDHGLQEKLGFSGVHDMKIKMAYLTIQTHALYGIPPSKEQLETLQSVFPCLPQPRVKRTTEEI